MERIFFQEQCRTTRYVRVHWLIRVQCSLANWQNSEYWLADHISCGIQLGGRLLPHNWVWYSFWRGEIPNVNKSVVSQHSETNRNLTTTSLLVFTWIFLPQWVSLVLAEIIKCLFVQLFKQIVNSFAGIVWIVVNQVSRVWLGVLRVCQSPWLNLNHGMDWTNEPHW